MAAIYMLTHNLSVDTLKGHLDYSRGRLAYDRDTRDIAAQLDPFVPRIKEARIAQWDAWEREVFAQARVDAANEALDELTTDFGVDLLHVTRDRASPRFVRYFAVAPSAIVRLGLESQLGKVRDWPQMLATETDPLLTAYGPRFAQAIADGDAAVTERREAGLATATHRVMTLLPLVDDLNAARLGLYGVLTQRAAERRRSAQWPNGFFRRAPQHDAKAAEAEAEAPAAETN